MKRKGTKIYQSLVDQYCRTRHRVEQRQADIDRYEADIERAKNKFDSLPVNLQEDEDIKKWYDGYTGTLNCFSSMTRHNQLNDKEDMEESGDMLVDEYEEDLDVLYSSYDNFLF